MRTTVLLPVELHGVLKEIAERDQRSLHREIIYALTEFANSRATEVRAARYRAGRPERGEAEESE